MDLSVIMCAHNEERYLPDQMDALLSQEWTGDWELIVVDNLSSDSTAAIIRAYASKDDRVQLVHATERAGQSYAMNVGGEAAKGELLAFCDADDVVAPGWAAAIARGLGHHEVVTGPHELDLLNPPWLANSRGRSTEEPVGSFFGIFPTIRGANWGIRRAVWQRIGGIREDYSAGQDAELSLRCYLSGIDVVGIPEAIVHYRYRQSTRALWRQGFSYGAYRPRIARLLADADLPRPARFAGWKSWALLLLRTPGLLSAEGRAVWIWMAANRLGQVTGSIRERTVLV